MFVRVKTTPNSPRSSVQICETRRTGAGVKQVIVRYVGVAMNEREQRALVDLAESIRLRLEAERSEHLPLFPPEEVASSQERKRGKRGRKPKTAASVQEVRLGDLVEEARIIEGIQEVFGKLYDELGFEKLLESAALSRALKSSVLARLANPQSKHRTAALLEEDFGIRIPLDQIYAAMDGLHAVKDKAQQLVCHSTRSLIPGKVDVLFFDVTTLYFESVSADVLRAFGYSKDQKYHSVQVVLALATTHEGLPIGYRLFQGNTAEVKTLVKCIEDWKQNIDIGQVVMVADRAMMSEGNLKILEAAGIEYVIGASLRKLPEKKRNEVLSASDYRLHSFEEDLAWVKEFSLNGRRLIASYSSKRARKDTSDRARILENLQKRIGKKKSDSLKKLVSNQGYLKFTSVDGVANVQINQLKVDSDAAWDGMYGLITNSKRPIPELLSRYRRLWTIEAAFRVSKHDLKMRPIFHFKPERIEAHVCICFIAYALLMHARYRVALQQVNISPDGLRNELLRVQASILRDKKRGGRYRLPSNMSLVARGIYRAFHLERSLSPSPIP